MTSTHFQLNGWAATQNKKSVQIQPCNIKSTQISLMSTFAIELKKKTFGPLDLWLTKYPQQ